MRLCIAIYALLLGLLVISKLVVEFEYQHLISLAWILIVFFYMSREMNRIGKEDERKRLEDKWKI